MIEENIFRALAYKTAGRSPCKSRQYGVVLVNYKGKIISTGYNAPIYVSMICKECPRRVLNLPSGIGLSLCPAVHAEIMCLMNAIGERINNSTLYVSGCIPCKNCLSALILAGVSEIVCEELTYYDELSKKIYQNSNLLIRKYKER